MTQFLPPNLLALFAPRDPIPYLPPASKLPHEKKNGGYIGVGAFLQYFEVKFIIILFKWISFGKFTLVIACYMIFNVLRLLVKDCYHAIGS